MYSSDETCIRTLDLKGFGNKLGILKSMNQAFRDGVYERLMMKRHHESADLYIKKKHLEAFDDMSVNIDVMELGYLSIDMDYVINLARMGNSRNLRTIFLTKHYLPKLRNKFDELRQSAKNNDMRLNNQIIKTSKELNKIIDKINRANYMNGTNFRKRVSFLEDELETA